MKYKMMPVIKDTEIEKAVKLQYGEDIELAPLMWPGDYMNDCFKELFFGEDEIAEYRDFSEDYGEKIARHHLLVFSILKDVFPDHDSVLVDVSW